MASELVQSSDGGPEKWHEALAAVDARLGELSRDELCVGLAQDDWRLFEKFCRRAEPELLQAALEAFGDKLDYRGHWVGLLESTAEGPEKFAAYVAGTSGLQESLTVKDNCIWLVARCVQYAKHYGEESLSRYFELITELVDTGRMPEAAAPVRDGSGGFHPDVVGLRHVLMHVINPVEPRQTRLLILDSARTALARVGNLLDALEGKGSVVEQMDVLKEMIRFPR